jgi:hypothetical protein
MPPLKSYLSGIALAATVVLFCSSNADATVYVVTATGVVAQGSNDPSNLFGGGNLSGDSFTETFSFDSSLNTVSSPFAHANVLAGAGTVTMTINGHSFTASTVDSGDGITLKYYLHDLGPVCCNYDSLEGSISGTTPDGESVSTYASIVSNVTDFVLGPSFDQSIFYALQPGDGWTFDFQISGLDGTESWGGNVNTIALSSTPLPSTWTLMLVGLFGLSFVAYGRNRKDAVAFTA